MLVQERGDPFLDFRVMAEQQVPAACQGDEVGPRDLLSGIGAD
jgi:hypothetical protein